MDNNTIRAAYEQIADSYVSQRDQFKSLPYLQRFATHVPQGGNILDVGCGGGVPVDAFLADAGYVVHGIDISPRMIALAKENIAQATYDVVDMSDLQPGQFQVDGIVSLYAIFHTPREGHGDLFRTFASFMGTGGALLVTMGESDWEGSDDFHGIEMSWSHYDAEINARLVETAGFQIQSNEIDDSADEKHQIIIATRK